MTPIPASRKVEVIAHRGLQLSARENTLDAFEAAIAAGADAIELDVHATSDGIVVVHHDFAIASTGAPGIDIAKSTKSDATSAAAAMKFTLPTLEEVLKRVSGRAKLYIEVKAPGIELLVARILRVSEAEFAVHSFDHRIVKRIRDFIPGVQTGVLTVSRPVSPARILSDAAASDYWPQADFVDRDLVTDIHESDGRVVVWTPNQPADWERLVGLNVDGICTDRPDELSAWLSRRFYSTPHKPPIRRL